MTQFARKIDWQERLADYLDQHRDTPFDWGKHDCALFAAGAVEAMTGKDPIPAFRGQYDDPESAMLALRQHGKGTLYGTMRKLFGKPKAASLAQRGDLVMLDRKTVGICAGQYTYTLSENAVTDGLVTFPTLEAQFAFSLPFGGAE